jgi:LysR family transcriptional regulator for metE and metH
MNLERFDLNKLHTFAAVADCGGVTAAARRLGLTPSAVSQGLGVLEAQLGIELFHRVGRGLVLSREGEALHRRFVDVRDRLTEALDDIVNAEHEIRGVVRVGLYLGFPRDRLADLLAGFASRHPRASVRVRYESREDLERGVLDGRLDLAFALDRAVGRAVHSVRLFRQPLVLVASEPLWRRRLRFDDLPRLPLVDYYPTAPLVHRWIRHHFRRKPPPLDVRVWAASGNLALDLVRRGVGAAVLPDALVRAQPASDRLRRLTAGRTELVDAIWLNALPGALRRPVADAFRQEAEAAFAAG